MAVGSVVLVVSLAQPEFDFCARFSNKKGSEAKLAVRSPRWLRNSRSNPRACSVHSLGKQGSRMRVSTSAL